MLRRARYWPLENLLEDADDDLFSRVLRNENHVLQPMLLESNDHGYV